MHQHIYMRGTLGCKSCATILTNPLTIHLNLFKPLPEVAQPRMLVQLALLQSVPHFMSWRQVLPDERFEYNYCPHAGIWRGYAVESLIYLHGHEHCSCHRSKHPDNVTWFLQHIDFEHGTYPMHHSHSWLVIAQLREQLPSLRLGFVVHVDLTVSYGQIRRCCKTLSKGTL
jgi:hypothetical protein